MWRGGLSRGLSVSAPVFWRRLATFGASLEPGPFAPPALPGFLGSTDLYANPTRTLSDRHRTRTGRHDRPRHGVFRGAHASLGTCHRHCLDATPGRMLRSLPQPCRPSAHVCPGRPAYRLSRGLLTVHSRYGLRTRRITQGDALHRSWHAFSRPAWRYCDIMNSGLWLGVES